MKEHDYSCIAHVLGAFDGLNYSMDPKRYGSGPSIKSLVPLLFHLPSKCKYI